MKYTTGVLQAGGFLDMLEYNCWNSDQGPGQGSYILISLFLWDLIECLLQQNPNQVSLLDTAKKLETRILLQNVEEAKKLVDAAYEYTQKW